MSSNHNPSSTLFQPLKIGPCNLSTRIVMGPISSNLANNKNVLSPAAVEYYSSRAQVPGTLLIGEATFISHAASGTPESRAGIWSDEQIASWKNIVSAVHARGSYIFLQLWALGRTADAAYKKNDGSGDVVGPSAIFAATEGLQGGGVVPRALTESEIQRYVDDYAQAARNAVHACGFDGVELHGGNGSLIDQFTQDVSNIRTDSWGGSIANRSRFALEIVRAIAAAIGPERVGFRLTPYSTYGSMGMADPVPQFLHVLHGLKDLDIAYIHLVESRIAGRTDVEGGAPLTPFVDFWTATGRPLVLAGGYGAAEAQAVVDGEYTGRDVAVAFGRAFVSNPDLVHRVREGLELVSG